MRVYVYHVNQDITLSTKLVSIAHQRLDVYIVLMILFVSNANNPTFYLIMILTVISVRFLYPAAMLVLIISPVFHVRVIMS